jgi:hypothetical protein
VVVENAKNLSSTNVAEVGPGAFIYIPTFMQFDSGTQKLIAEGIHRQTDRQHGDLITLL